MWALVVPALLLAASAEVPLRPEVGEPAPEFTLAASDGTTVRLADYRGRKTVVLAFFPKAFTGG